MSKQRKHTVSIHKSVYHDVNTGAYAALGGPFYIKKLLGKAHYLVRASDAFYHEVSPACFEATLENSKHLDTYSIKKRLEAFHEHQS
tara:strand:+ start:2713 stop:2973 length:261 start_codon:yes stop_codon:yes gene_type:complete